MRAAQEIAKLQGMGTREHRRRPAEVFGEETRSGNRPYLIKRLAWRIQANAEGDISERARRRAEEIARDADLRLKAPRNVVQSGRSSASGRIRRTGDERLPMPGTVLTREYKGTTVRVTVLEDGFEHEGELYRSLSAVAKAVTGSHWNGYLFFGCA